MGEGRRCRVGKKKEMEGEKDKIKRARTDVRTGKKRRGQHERGVFVWKQSETGKRRKRGSNERGAASWVRH